MSTNKIITKIFTFDSAHYLQGYDGKCKNLHGHTYKLEISLKGEIDSFGFIIDFHELDNIINENILEKLDHKNLNEVFEFTPTCELIAEWIFIECTKLFKKPTIDVYKVVLWETPTSFVTITQ